MWQAQKRESFRSPDGGPDKLSWSCTNCSRSRRGPAHTWHRRSRGCTGSKSRPRLKDNQGGHTVALTSSSHTLMSDHPNIVLFWSTATALHHLQVFTTLTPPPSPWTCPLNLLFNPLCTLETHFTMKNTGAKQGESRSHPLFRCNKCSTFFPQNLKISLRLIIHSSLSLIINDVKAGCILLFLQHNTGVQAASDRGNCRSEFITSPVRVPGFFIIPKIYHVIYAVTLSWYV